MSFNVTPKAGPSIPFVEKPAGQSQEAKSSRERAMAAFMGGQQDTNTPGRQAAPPAPQDAFDIALAKANAQANNQPENPPVTENTQESIQKDTTEAATSQPAKVEEQQPPLSQHYAVLARKERALRAETKRLNDERAAFRAEREAAKSGGSQVSPPASQTQQAPTQDTATFTSERLLQDPVGVFEELGLSQEELAQKLLNYQPTDKRLAAYIRKLEAQVAEVKASQDETRKTYETNQSASVEQALDNIRFEAEQLIESDPAFATIKATGQSEEVVTLIKGIFDEGLPGKYRKGTLLTVEQAAQLVEDELVAQWIDQHEKLSKLEKIQKRINKPTTPVAQPGTTQQGQSQQATGQPIKTLTNSMGATGKTLSARERAIAVFNGTKAS